MLRSTPEAGQPGGCFEAMAASLGKEGSDQGRKPLGSAIQAQFFNKARRIDTKLVEPLEHLRIATGRAVAPRAPQLRKKLQGVRAVPALTRQQVREGAASEAQVEVLEGAGFLERTPLRHYVLTVPAALGGQGLGPAGSTIVAEVLVGLVRRSENLILRSPNWTPTLSSEQAVLKTFDGAEVLLDGESPCG